MKDFQSNTLPLGLTMLNNAILNMWEKKIKLTVARMLNQKAMSTLAKLHTTFPESLKMGLKDLKRNTLPFRFSIPYHLLRISEKRSERLKAIRFIANKIYHPLLIQHDLFGC